MNKFHGKVGFWKGNKETGFDVWEPDIEERTYIGNVLVNNRKFKPSSDSQNDTLTTTNRISILSDLFARENWESIRYVVWNGTAWKVISVGLDYPRLTLELGGVWNGKTEERTVQNIS